MIAVKGFSKFPVFHDSTGRRTIGLIEIDGESDFYKYVQKNTRKGIFLMYDKIDFPYLTRRIVVDGKAINPEKEDRVERVPSYVYPYPDTKGQEVVDNVFCLGVVIQSRKPIFLPLIILRKLDEQEKTIIGSLTNIYTNDINIIASHVRKLGINITVTPNNNREYVLRIVDEYVDDTYYMLVDENGQYVASNVCFYPHRQMYAIECILLIRENNGTFVIYSPDRYRWI